MNNQDSWYNQDEFWEDLEPVLFSRERQNAAPQEVDNIINLLGIEASSPILDLGCGIGRHTLELAHRGFTVTGVDRTQTYLNKAREKARIGGLEVEFVQADMRSFRRTGAFEAVINLFSSFGYFENPEEDRRVVENVYDSLKPGGRFLVEMMGKEVLARIFRERDWYEQDGYLILEERRLSQNWGWIESRWIVIKGKQFMEHTISLRIYSAAELSSLLRECGFRDTQVYGGLDGSAYDTSAKRLVVVGLK